MSACLGGEPSLEGVAAGLGETPSPGAEPLLAWDVVSAVFPPTPVAPNAGRQPLPEAAARELDRDKARCTMHVSSSPPLRTGLAVLTAPGSAPVIILHGMPMKRRCQFRQFHECPPVYSLRVHWVP